MTSAREYLQAQGIEQELAQAVATIIKEQPPNAIARIGQLLSTKALPSKQAEVPLGAWNIISAHIPYAPHMTFTSQVVGPGKEFPELNWKTTAWLVPHESLRWLVKLVNFVVKHPNFDAKEPFKAKAFSTLFNEIYYPFIEAHHTGEDAVISKHLPDVYGSTGKVSSQHKEFDTSLKKMQEIVNSMSEGSGLDQMSDFLSIHAAFENDLLSHLAEEERISPPLLEGKFTEETFNGMLGAELIPHDIQAGCAYHGPEKYMSEIFPCILAIIFATMEVWGGPQAAAGMHANLPPPVQEAYANVRPAVKRLIIDPVLLCCM